MRSTGRAASELRAIELTPHILPHAEGSCLVKFGNTHVICTASVEEKVPPFLRNKGKGWITAEYGMLPRSTGTRMNREAYSGKQSGRTVEIQRLIGRALRSVVNTELLGERQIIIDCDVISADGGTRTAAITGSYVALALAVNKVMSDYYLRHNPLLDHVAAVSCGIVDGEVVLDLDYLEDSSAEVDANFVLSGSGHIIELQGTAEGKPFSEEQFMGMLSFARQGIHQLVLLQQEAIAKGLKAA